MYTMLSYKKKIYLTIGLGLLIFLTIACSLTLSSKVGLGSIEVQNLAVSQDIDTDGRPVSPSSVFSTNIERIFVSFYLETNDTVPITTLWYKEDEIIFKQEGSHQRGQVFTWIEPKHQFTSGKYKVEVLWLTTVLATTEFKIEPNPI